MKVEIDNLNALLNKYARPAVGFIGGAIEEPIMKIGTEKKSLVLECSTPDRSVKLFVDSKVEEKGESFIIARSLSSIRSSHKQAVLSQQKGKLVVKSASKGRKLILNIDTVGEDNYTSFSLPKLPTQTLADIDIIELKKILTRMNISPVIILDNSKPLIAFLPQKKGFRAVVNDDIRVIMLEAPKSKLNFEKRLMTDFQDLQTVVDLMVQMADKASISFTKKAITASGYNGSKSKVADVRLNYSMPGTEYVERSLGIVNMAQKDKTNRMGFVGDEHFKEILDNVINLANIKSKKGHIDISLNKGVIEITGAGPSSTYTESLKVKNSVGKGIVRIQSTALQDITKLFAKKVLFVVKSSSVVLTNKWPDHNLYFYLPFLTFSKEKK